MTYAWDEWMDNPPLPRIDVFGEGQLRHTGILDESGYPIFRRSPIGFGREDEYVIRIPLNENKRHDADEEGDE